MIWIVFILAVTVAAADIWAWKRCLRRRIASRAWRRLVASVLMVGDLLPAAVFLIGYFVQDNTTAVMHLSMWLIYLYLLFSLPRMAFYFFAALSRRRALRIAGATVAAVLSIILLWGMAVCRTHLVVNHVELRFDNLPEGFDGMRIAFISDLHIGALVRPEIEVGRLVDTINSLHPDLVVSSGDLVNVRYTELDERMMLMLGSIEAPLGVVSSIGNHDVGVYVKDSVALPREENLTRLIERQRAMGWLVLDDTTVYLHRGGDSLSLTGISFPLSQRNLRHKRTLPGIDVERAFRNVPDSIFNITVSHLPQLWDEVARRGYGELMLSGHVHSMQMKIRLLGRQFSPARLLYREWSGLYRRPGSNLYVNDGIGAVGYPMRLGACPEVTLIVLRGGGK